MFFTGPLDVLAAVGYSVIGWQFWRQHRAQKDSKAKRSLRYLVFIFVLGGVCGFAFHFVAMFGLTETPRIIFMLPLVAVVWMFVGRQEVVRIVEALERDAEKLIKLEGE